MRVSFKTVKVRPVLYGRNNVCATRAVLKLLVTALPAWKEAGEINFDNIFYSTSSVQNINILTGSQYTELLRFFFSVLCP